MQISVILPAFNEAGNIAQLVRETFEVLPDQLVFEVIVVDDCSDDDTGSEIRALIPAFPKLRYIRHATRAGQSAAMRTGILAASSLIVATMDGDGQNDPRDIPSLVERLGAPGSDGPALVGGVRINRQAEGSKRAASRAANWIRDTILRDECPDSGCGIKAYWRDAFLKLPFFTSIHRYLPALFISYGHKVAYVPVNDRPRKAGQSKYNNLGRALIGIYDLIGVSWLRRRTKAPAIGEDIGGRQGAPITARLVWRSDVAKKTSGDSA